MMHELSFHKDKEYFAVGTNALQLDSASPGALNTL